MKLDRRTVLAGTLGGAAALTLSPGLVSSVLAQEKVNVDALLKEPELGDMALGPDDAAVTIVEYASMSCPHCASFHNNTWKDLKSEYVDSGKVRFIFREFPLNNSAFAVSMIARCAPEERFFDVINLYFQELNNWARAQDQYAALLDLAKQVGFTEESFKECLTNQSLYEGLNAERERAANTFGVSSTPTFFINGVKQTGALDLDAFKGSIDPLL